MKKGIVTIGIGLTAFSVTALGIMNWSHFSKNRSVISKQEKTNYREKDAKHDFEFHYQIDSRFATTITQEKLREATSVTDLVPASATKEIEKFEDVNIVLHTAHGNISQTGESNALNADQLALLKTMTYSTNFNIEALSFTKERGIEPLKKECFVYYITVIPEKEANYKQGKEALLNYLKLHSEKDVAKVDEGKLRPGKIKFTVSESGKISDVKLDSTCGYKTIDKRMLNLLKEIPGTWTPAESSKGKKVDQVLYFSFGLIGC